MIARLIGIAYFLVAYSADEEPKFRHDIVELLTFTTIVLIRTAWNMLLALAVRAFY